MIHGWWSENSIRKVASVYDMIPNHKRCFTNKHDDLCIVLITQKCTLQSTDKCRNMHSWLTHSLKFICTNEIIITFKSFLCLQMSKKYLWHSFHSVFFFFTFQSKVTGLLRYTVPVQGFESALSTDRPTWPSRLIRRAHLSLDPLLRL